MEFSPIFTWSACIAAVNCSLLLFLVAGKRKRDRQLDRIEKALAVAKVLAADAASVSRATDAKAALILDTAPGGPRP